MHRPSVLCLSGCPFSVPSAGSTSCKGSTVNCWGSSGCSPWPCFHLTLPFSVSSTSTLPLLCLRKLIYGHLEWACLFFTFRLDFSHCCITSYLTIQRLKNATILFSLMMPWVGWAHLGSLLLHLMSCHGRPLGTLLGTPLEHPRWHSRASWRLVGMARSLATVRQGSLKLSLQVVSGPLLLHEPFLSRGLSGTRESDFSHGSSGLLKLWKLKLLRPLEL